MMIIVVIELCKIDTWLRSIRSLRWILSTKWTRRFAPQPSSAKCSFWARSISWADCEMFIAFINIIYSLSVLLVSTADLNIHKSVPLCVSLYFQPVKSFPSVLYLMSRLVCLIKRVSRGRSDALSFITLHHLQQWGSHLISPSHVF